MAPRGRGTEAVHDTKTRTTGARSHCRHWDMHALTRSHCPAGPLHFPTRPAPLPPPPASAPCCPCKPAPALPACLPVLATTVLPFPSPTTRPPPLACSYYSHIHIAAHGRVLPRPLIVALNRPPPPGPRNTKDTKPVRGGVAGTTRLRGDVPDDGPRRGHEAPQRAPLDHLRGGRKSFGGTRRGGLVTNHTSTPQARGHQRLQGGGCWLIYPPRLPRAAKPATRWGRDETTIRTHRRHKNTRREEAVFVR